MSGFARGAPSLDDDVMALMAQLRESPPDWLQGGGAQDAATTAMARAMAAAQAEAAGQEEQEESGELSLWYHSATV